MVQTDLSTSLIGQTRETPAFPNFKTEIFNILSFLFEFPYFSSHQNITTNVLDWTKISKMEIDFSLIVKFGASNLAGLIVGSEQRRR